MNSDNVKEWKEVKHNAFKLGALMWGQFMCVYVYNLSLHMDLKENIGQSALLIW